jgi:hypothetical protein
VKLQSIDDLVDHFALGAHGEPDQIELGADRPFRLTRSLPASSVKTRKFLSMTRGYPFLPAR